MKNPFSLLLILFCFISCHHNKESIKTPLTTKTVVNSLEIEKEISDSVELELSDIAENLQIVRLETLESVVMGGI